MIDSQRITPNLRRKTPFQQVKKAKEAGFTLIELMVVIAIVGILATVAGGSFGDMADKRRAESAAGELRAILTSARLSALSKGEKVRVTINYGDGATKGISATHLGGIYTAATKKVAGSERLSQGVYWFKASTASNGCAKVAGGALKTIEFSARATATDLTDAGTPSVVVSSDPAGTKNLHCLQVRIVTGRVEMMK